MHKDLKAYREKRNFGRTPEPEGENASAGGGLRFVVQRHMARREHYDLRLEWDGALLSWAVPKGPSYNTKERRLAIRVEAHPLEYRNFEGTIPKGEYGGGVVMLFDEGFWSPYVDVEGGLLGGSLKFELRGRRLKGKWALVRMKGKPGEQKENWLLLKERDEWANIEESVLAADTSVRTGRTMAEIEAGGEAALRKNPFSSAQAQLARLASAPPKEDADWLYEMKYDGYRILAYVEGNGVRLMTRNGSDYTGRFRGVADALLDLASGRAMVLDGEIAVIDAAGRTDFQALQNHMKHPAGERLAYLLFDLLALDGVDMRERPLIERKEKLEALLQDAPSILYYSRHVRGNGRESLLAACAAGMEGIVGKKMDAPYAGLRNGDWIKLKCAKRQGFVIGGYTQTDKRVNGVSALLLGAYEAGRLMYAGRAGSGLSGEDMRVLLGQFQGLERAEAPFVNPPEVRTNEKITWLAPRLVAEIQFREWTKDDLLRQASYKGLRADKAPEEVVMERVEPAQGGKETGEREERMQAQEDSGELVVEGITITNPDKLIFENPAVTKGEVAAYYRDVAARMLPYVSRRILSIVRCPKGVAAACFYKKHPGSAGKGVVAIPIETGKGEVEEYFYIEDIAGLVGEAQMGTLEFHTWGSRVDALEQPDIMVFDLDPDEGMALDRVRQGVLDVKNILHELSLESYLKTSGGKGYHVVVPLRPSASWEAFHDFARRVAEVMEQKWPDRYTSNVRKAKRANRVFIDWIRNGRGATSIAPYSIRAREGARVSMPIAWEELNSVAPDQITMAEAVRRMGGRDPWQDFFKTDQMLK